jgi:hypothetical protein
MIDKRRSLVGMASALVAPGIGRAIIENIWIGIGLYSFFVLLWVLVIAKGWLGLVLRFAIWALFASVDMTRVVRALDGKVAPSSSNRSSMLLSVVGYLLILTGLCSAIVLIGETLVFNHLSLVFGVGALGIVIGDKLFDVGERQG